MGSYSIKDVEILSGVKAHTLRIWEQRYHLLEPERTDTNIRYYSDDQLRLLLNVATLNRNGMKISKIARLKKHELNNEVLKVFEATSEPDNLLDSLIHSMIDFDERRFEKTLSSAIIKLGFEGSFNKLIFPFLIRTGVLWATGSVRVSQEHFISNLIRRKISAAIDGVFNEPVAGAKKFVLFLPEGETHELLLMFIDYTLRKNNQHVAYLGCSLPFDELSFVNESFKPDFLVTYRTVSNDTMSFDTYIKKICGAFPKCRIIISGQQATELAKLPANCKVVRSADELISLTA